MMFPSPRAFAAASLALLLGACSHPAVVRVAIPTPSPVTTAALAPPKPAIAAAPAALALSPKASLTSLINTYIAAPRFKHADWGIEVVDLRSGHTLYSHEGERLFVPASNAKLFTAALALATLGAGHRFHTTLYTTATTRANGILAGDLIVAGGGDPSFGVAASSRDWADRFAQGLANLGITRVDGDIVGDDTLFDGVGFGSGWEANDLQAWYAPRVSALNVAGNQVAVTVSRHGTRCCNATIEPAWAPLKIANFSFQSSPDAALIVGRRPGSDTIHVSGRLAPGRGSRRIAMSAPDPARLAAATLREALSRHGIQVHGRTRTVHWPAASAVNARARVLGRIASPPLAAIVRHMLKESDNLYAQTLLLDVGVATARAGVCRDRERAPPTSEGWGLCALRALLAQIGIADGAHFSEGSGLSRHDLVTPRAVTKLLAWVDRQPFAAAFHAALPVAGVDGTLAHRFRGTASAGNLSAKTGTLNHVYALAGYLTNAGGEPLVFALYLNRYLRPRDALGRTIPPSPRSDLDAVANLIQGSGSPRNPR